MSNRLSLGARFRRQSLAPRGATLAGVGDCKFHARGVDRVVINSVHPYLSALIPFDPFSVCVAHIALCPQSRCRPRTVA